MNLENTTAYYKGLQHRVKQLVKDTSGEQKIFAEKIKVPASTLNSFLQGEVKNPGKVIYAISQHMPDVDMNWLLKGQSSSIRKTESANLDIAMEETEPYTPSDEERRLSSLEARLSEVVGRLSAVEKELGKKKGEDVG